MGISSVMCVNCQDDLSNFKNAEPFHIIFVVDTSKSVDTIIFKTFYMPALQL